jgi:hypothetical protein
VAASIGNEDRLRRTESLLETLRQDLLDFQATEKDCNPIRYKLGVNSFNGLIKDLENQIEEYKNK